MKATVLWIQYNELISRAEKLELEFQKTGNPHNINQAQLSRQTAARMKAAIQGGRK